MQLELRLVSQRCQTLDLELEVTKAKGNSGTGAGESSGTPPSQDAQAELRHFSKLLAGALPQFPTEAEVPVWFEFVATHWRRTWYHGNCGAKLCFR
ncbi:hypothetical protein HPB48_018100 [Haemaphysalis longicornis]|uniref:Uncharacterized protein n=1 Tax=Haemaphysalis longicornis TaxID=44386 RepID=A0A9J6GIW7_HAELO|nr:hypothetical protein HPB48_018100 [Haemaphysalis longicornis]